MMESHDNFLTRDVEIWENERYQLSALSFSAKGLLPTDRTNCSMRNGYVGWPSMNMMEESLISAGWEWEESSSWRVDTVLGQTDQDGWIYSTSFGAIDEEGHAACGRTHFVRRRKKTRRQAFVAKSYFPSGTCDHCDLEEKRRLARKLLEVLAVTSLAFDQKCLSEATLNHMKSRLMMRLELGACDSPPLDYCVACDRLNSFPKYALDSGKNKWIRAASEGQSNTEYENLALRSAEIGRFWFTPAEQMEVAKLFIQRHDLNYKYHCETLLCGEDCEYIPLPCVNENCGEEVSRKWLEKHDAMCVHKRVPCERECGEAVPRRLMEHHLSKDCDLRPVQCTYADLGCEAELVYRNLMGHLDSGVNHHLQLSVRRVIEQQAVIVGLNKRLTTLETLVHNSTTKVGVVETTTAASVAAVALSTRNLSERVDEDMQAMEKRHKSEMQAMQKALQQTNTQVGGIDQRVTRLAVASAASQAGSK